MMYEFISIYRENIVIFSTSLALYYVVIWAIIVEKFTQLFSKEADD